MVSRGIRRVSLDHYESNQDLANLIARIASDYAPALFIDPCAGFGSIFHHLPEPKRAFDIQVRFPECEQQDFLESVRPCCNNTTICVVMNPPFSMKKQRNGVVAFLNHASNILRSGEVCISVAPQTMRRWNNISRVKADMHLEKEFVIHKACPFRCDNGKSVDVSIVIQIWRKYSDRARSQPEFLRCHADFRVQCSLTDQRPVFFIKVWGVTKNIGKTSSLLLEDSSQCADSLKCAVGTIRKKGGTAYCVYGDELVRTKIEKMYARGDFVKYCDKTSAGINNPFISASELYSIYEFGVEYYAKKRWNIEVVHLMN